jgi:hypothetical protein
MGVGLTGWGGVGRGMMHPRAVTPGPQDDSDRKEERGAVCYSSQPICCCAMKLPVQLLVLMLQFCSSACFRSRDRSCVTVFVSSGCWSYNRILIVMLLCPCSVSYRFSFAIHHGLAANERKTKITGSLLDVLVLKWRNQFLVENWCCCCCCCCYN